MLNARIILRTALLATLALHLSPSARAATPFDPAFAGGQTPEYLSTISDPCIPWRVPCKLPEEAKIGKDEGFIAPPVGETWVQTPSGWNKCTDTMCEVQPHTCAQDPSIPPCKAQEERKTLEANKKMFSSTDSDGHGVDKNSGNLVGKAVPYEAFKSQRSDNSLFSAKSVGPSGASASNDWSGVDKAVGALANVSDNGNAVSVGGPGGSAGAAPGGRSALGDAQRMRRQASISGQSDHTVWQDVVAWAQKFDLLGTDVSNDSSILDPGYKNTDTLGRRVDRRNAPRD